jgi:hypothetical protein
MPVQICKVGQPGILDNRAAVRPSRNPSQIRRADIRRQQTALAGEGQVDDAIVPRSSQRRSPGCHLLHKRHEALGLRAAVIE